MQLWGRMVIFLVCLYGIGWFISFELNPYNICVDHTDKDLARDYYQCKPFAFTLKKGTVLERKENQRTFPWEQNNQNMPKSEDIDQIKRRKAAERERSRQRVLKEVINYDCDPEFYTYSKEEREEMSTEEILSFCSKKTKLKQAPRYKDMSKEL